MPTITGIEPQKNKNRVNIFLDGKFAFGASLEMVLRHGLRAGKELSEEKLKEFKKESNTEKIHAKALRFATLRPRSEKEIKLWFKRKGTDTQEAPVVFNRLKSLKLADDEAFARWWILQRSQFRPKGKIALTAELKQKGVGRKIIERVLEAQEVPEKELAREAAVKKLTRLSRLPVEKKKQKLLSFLGRRGFSWETAKDAVDEILQKEVK